MSQSPGRYAEAGVDVDAGAELVRAIAPHARATARPGVMGGLGGFAALFDLAACGLRDPILVAATDGVGTKVLLGLDAGRLRGLGVDLVAMCVNDLVVQGAQPLFFLDYYATGRLDVAAATEVVAGIADGCRDAGCALIGGETAEMPGLYARGHFDLAGFAVGAVERDCVLPRRDAIVPGDVVLGLPSSGLHSNGFSLVRKIVGEVGAGLDAPAPFTAGQSLGEALLTPTRIYVRACLAAAATGAVKAMAHITGGGLVENLPRVLPAGVTARLDARSWPLPPTIAWLADIGRLSGADLARTFNAGIGMALVTAAEDADAVCAALGAHGEAPLVIGRITPADGPAGVGLSGTDAWPGAASRS